jgi:hypothetical protein
MHQLRRVLITNVFTALLFSTGVAQEQPPLFDGETLAGWTMLDGSAVTKGWEVVDGAIHLKSAEGRRVGHIITDREYGDFDLSFEWKIAPGGNSGVKYRVRDYGFGIRGCEYQILGSGNDEEQSAGRGSTGGIYDLYEPLATKQRKPPGEYNLARIVMHKNHIQHWLNGQLIVSATIGSPDWKKRLAESKFSDIDDFATNRYGKIMLTDHGSEVWYRNFEFYPLEPSVGRQ